LVQVVVFGLFHGLVVLPIILSWIGPRPNVELKTDSDDSTTASSNDVEPATADDGYKKSTSQLDVTFVSEDGNSIKNS
jgi:hypothetical protein